jgi:hypothetical protein
VSAASGECRGSARQLCAAGAARWLVPSRSQLGDAAAWPVPRAVATCPREVAGPAQRARQCVRRPPLSGRTTCSAAPAGGRGAASGRAGAPPRPHPRRAVGLRVPAGRGGPGPGARAADPAGRRADLNDQLDKLGTKMLTVVPGQGFKRRDPDAARHRRRDDRADPDGGDRGGRPGRQRDDAQERPGAGQPDRRTRCCRRRPEPAAHGRRDAGDRAGGWTQQPRSIPPWCWARRPPAGSGSPICGRGSGSGWTIAGSA